MLRGTEYKLAKELQPTAITLDVMMPDLDGWSVLAALRQNPELADIPVIMVSIVDDKRRGISPPVHPLHPDDNFRPFMTPDRM